MKKIILQRFFVSILMVLIMQLSGCSNNVKNSDSVKFNLDQAAESYVKLGLELGEYDTDYVDAYLGPAQWKKDAKQKLRSKQQLAKDIASLLDTLSSYTPEKNINSKRSKALLLNLRAMDARIRMVNGETFTFAEEAQLIYDAILPEYDFDEFDHTLAEIEKLIPGPGDLATRVDNFRNTFIIPEKQVKAVVDLAIAECSRRSGEYILLPSSQRFTLEYVNGKNWSGYNWYQGGNHSLMQINQDFPMKIDRAIGLGCHEGYPGHHVWNILIENQLLKKNGWIEFSLFPLFSPYGLIAEGSANYGVELAFPNDEKITYEQQILFPLAGLNPAKAESLDKLNKLTRKLSHSTTATAQLYLDGKITRKQAIEQRRKYGLVSRARAEQSLKFIEQYRAYVLNYNLGKDLVADYVEKQGNAIDDRWKAFEQMLTELKAASDMITK